LIYLKEAESSRLRVDKGGGGGASAPSVLKTFRIKDNIKILKILISETESIF
jgi:hypothetical protein